MQGVEGHKFETVTLKRSEVKAGWKRWVLNVFSIINGLFLSIIALIFTVTIIGFFFAIPVWLGAFASFMYPFMYGTFTKCPNCGKKLGVLKKSDSAKCGRCKLPIKVEWID